MIEIKLTLEEYKFLIKCAEVGFEPNDYMLSEVHPKLEAIIERIEESIKS